MIPIRVNGCCVGRVQVFHCKHLRSLLDVIAPYLEDGWGLAGAIVPVGPLPRWAATLVKRPRITITQGEE